MPTIEFQSESSQWSEFQTLDRTASLGYCDALQSQASLQSMLLGLHFRQNLTLSEKDFLPLLVLPSASIFLRLGEKYLNLDDTREAPTNAIPTAQVTGTDAMFTHRWCPDRVDLSGTKLIHTVRIGRIDGRDLMLGVTEPDTGPSQAAIQSNMASLVDNFRQALTDAGAVARHLRPRLPQSGAWLLINRASGRVLATGRQVGALLNIHEAELTGQEYSSLTDSLRPIVVERGLRLDNIEIREQYLTIVTILAGRSKPSTRKSDRKSDQFFDEFFAHMMRNKLSVITTASSHLGSLATERNQSDEAELAEIILSQADELDRQVERLRVLFDYHQLQPTTTTLGYMVTATVARLEQSNHQTEAAIPAELAATSWDIPPVAGEVLIEAIVLSQRGAERSETQTQITGSIDSPVSIEITSSLADGNPPARFRSGWQDYVQRLATLMGLSCQWHRPDEKTLVTVITPTANRK